MAEPAPAPEATAPLVTLVTSDAQRFVVTRGVVALCKTILNILDECSGDDGAPLVPLPAVDAATLTHFIVVANKAVELKEEVREWFKEYATKNLSQKDLFELLMAANYLNAKVVLDACCNFVASMIAGKTPEQIREVFNIKNDFSVEEEEEILRENAWAFE